ncbi:unnamed protein product [Arabis nemorensis]|uniref:Uncharacterized protein n=1 Tax=Arabis nemorensis TaxID=586526 RepID=A0A565CWE8_9BRAS|nr:unnamed protein product [Arabis nemorensis]
MPPKCELCEDYGHRCPTTVVPSVSTGSKDVQPRVGGTPLSKPLHNQSVSSASANIQPVTSAQFDDEEELIKAAQLIIRNRIASSQAVPSQHGHGASNKKGKKARQLQRKQLMILSSPLTVPPDPSGTVTSAPPQVPCTAPPTSFL